MNPSYPRRCVNCKQKALEPSSIEFRTEVKHENALHEVFVPDLPCEKCTNCGFVLLDEDADARVHEVLRQQLRLLPAATLTNCRNQLKVSQKRLAELCGFAPESVSRWESGTLQSRSTDRLFRLYFGVPQARQFLERLESDFELGASVIWEVECTAIYANDLLGQALVTHREHGPDPPSGTVQKGSLQALTFE